MQPQSKRGCILATSFFPKGAQLRFAIKCDATPNKRISTVLLCKSVFMATFLAKKWRNSGPNKQLL